MIRNQERGKYSWLNKIIRCQACCELKKKKRRKLKIKAKKPSKKMDETHNIEGEEPKPITTEEQEQTLKTPDIEEIKEKIDEVRKYPLTERKTEMDMMQMMQQIMTQVQESNRKADESSKKAEENKQEIKQDILRIEHRMDKMRVEITTETEYLVNQRIEESRNVCKDEIKEINVITDNLSTEINQLNTDLINTNTRVEKNSNEIHDVKNRYYIDIRNAEEQIRAEVEEKSEEAERKIEEKLLKKVNQAEERIEKNTKINCKIFEERLKETMTRNIRSRAVTEGVDTDSTSITNQINKMKNLIPIFMDNCQLHPMKYMFNLKNFIKMHMNDNFNDNHECIMNVIKRTLRGDPEIWFNIIEERCNNFRTFEHLFTEKFWSTTQQNKCRNKLVLGRYDERTEKSRELYAMKLYGEVRYLEPAMEERDLIAKIANHFSDEIGLQVVTKDMNTLEIFLQYLRRIDDASKGKARSRVRVNVIENKSPERNEQPNVVQQKNGYNRNTSRNNDNNYHRYNNYDNQYNNRYDNNYHRYNNYGNQYNDRYDNNYRRYNNYDNRNKGYRNYKNYDNQRYYRNKYENNSYRNNERSSTQEEKETQKQSGSQERNIEEKNLQQRYDRIRSNQNSSQQEKKDF